MKKSDINYDIIGDNGWGDDALVSHRIVKDIEICRGANSWIVFLNGRFFAIFCTKYNAMECVDRMIENYDELIKKEEN